MGQKLGGAYVLVTRVRYPFSKNVGSLGRIRFEKGNYLYVGSALGSLFPRLGRHFAKEKKIHWHIDYLTTARNAKVLYAIYAKANSRKLECDVSRYLSHIFLNSVRSFGASDCKSGCPSHLFYCEKLSKRELQLLASEAFTRLGSRPSIFKPTHE